MAPEYTQPELDPIANSEPECNSDQVGNSKFFSLVCFSKAYAIARPPSSEHPHLPIMGEVGDRKIWIDLGGTLNMNRIRSS